MAAGEHGSTTEAPPTRSSPTSGSRSRARLNHAIVERSSGCQALRSSTISPARTTMLQGL